LCTSNSICRTEETAPKINNTESHNH